MCGLLLREPAGRFAPTFVLGCWIGGGTVYSGKRCYDKFGICTRAEAARPAHPAVHRSAPDPRGDQFPSLRALREAGPGVRHPERTVPQKNVDHIVPTTSQAAAFAIPWPKQCWPPWKPCEEHASAFTASHGRQGMCHVDMHRRLGLTQPETDGLGDPNLTHGSEHRLRHRHQPCVMLALFFCFLFFFFCSRPRAFDPTKLKSRPSGEGRLPLGVRHDLIST